MADRTVAAHVCFGDLEPQMAMLEELAATQAMDWWTINRHARAGDIALFYLMRPVCSFVAWGVVASEAVRQTQGKWKGHWVANVSQVRMLARPVSLVELRQRLPQWRYLIYPRQSVCVPPRYVVQLLTLLGIRWQDAQGGDLLRSTAEGDPDGPS
jgi:hypothetical protein